VRQELHVDQRVRNEYLSLYTCLISLWSHGKPATSECDVPRWTSHRVQVHGASDPIAFCHHAFKISKASNALKHAGARSRLPK